jgi:hypothetical protein
MSECQQHLLMSYLQKGHIVYKKANAFDIFIKYKVVNRIIKTKGNYTSLHLGYILYQKASVVSYHELTLKTLLIFS